MPQLQLSMEVMDLDICHFVQYKPDGGDFDPPIMEVTIVQRDREWFKKNLPLFQKFIADVEEFKIHIDTLIPKEEEKEKPNNKKRRLETCMIADYDMLEKAKIPTTALVVN